MLLALSDLDSWPQQLNIGRHFVLLLALPSAPVSETTTRRIACTMVKQGLAYLCVCGPHADLFEGAVDSVLTETLGDEPEGSVIMTTAKQNLSEGLWHFLNCAWPEGRYAEECTAWLAVAVGDQRAAMEIRRRLSDPSFASAIAK